MPPLPLALALQKPPATPWAQDLQNLWKLLLKASEAPEPRTAGVCGASEPGREPGLRPGNERTVLRMAARMSHARKAVQLLCSHR